MFTNNLCLWFICWRCNDCASVCVSMAPILMATTTSEDKKCGLKWVKGYRILVVCEVYATEATKNWDAIHVFSTNYQSAPQMEKEKIPARPSLRYKLKFLLLYKFVEYIHLPLLWRISQTSVSNASEYLVGKIFYCGCNQNIFEYVYEINGTILGMSNQNICD